MIEFKKVKLNLLIIAISTMSISGVYAADTEKKSVCYSDFAQQLKDLQKEKKKNICEQVDTTVNVEDSPLIYTNPDAGCDLGLSMPGLPNIGVGLSGIDSCALLKSVTGSLVQDINEQMQDTVDSTLDALGGETEFDIDLGEISSGLATGEDVEIIGNNP